MAFEVTATRRRPQQFDSLAGQDFVVSTLKNAIAQNRIAHAYLFSGPRGVGKTTSARLLAKALNCEKGPTSEPCDECDNCRGITRGSSMDVIEIDGASNTSVNDIRLIKEEIMFPPVSSRYKIYIIDEVHMLSQSAFNALLKTIEEPPEYVVFIFATTETQKVPATIRSRCQQFNFQLIGLETIQRLLREACEENQIKASDDALFWIAKEATGSMRDAYTLFDQVVSFSDNDITLEKIREKLGLVGLDSMNSIMSDIIDFKEKNALDTVQTLLAKGISTDQLVKDFTDYFRSLLLISHGVTSQNVLGHLISEFPQNIVKTYNSEQLETAFDMFVNLYRNIRYSINPRFELELAVSKLSRLRYLASNTTVIEQLAKLKNDLISGAITPCKSTIEVNLPDFTTKDKPVVETIVEKPEEKVTKPDNQIISFTKESLKEVLPAGVANVVNNEHGLVLEFDSSFCYQAALKDFDNISAKIKTVTGNINVVAAFSEKLDKQRKENVQNIAIENEKKNSEKEKTESIDPQEEQKYFVEDLLSAFKGHEEK